MPCPDGEVTPVRVLPGQWEKREGKQGMSYRLITKLAWYRDVHASSRYLPTA